MAKDYQKVAEGEHCEIWMSSAALDTYKVAPDKDRARVDRILDYLSEQGQRGLNDEQFKNEGRFPTGSKDGSKVAVYAVKSHQLRIYGYWAANEPRRLILADAVIKKRNKANQSQLKSVAKKVGDFDGDQ